MLPPPQNSKFIPKGNVAEISKIVNEMTKNYKDAPNYNSAAAAIVQQGVVDKTNARNGYVTQLSGPKKTL